MKVNNPIPREVRLVQQAKKYFANAKVITWGEMWLFLPQEKTIYYTEWDENINTFDINNIERSLIDEEDNFATIIEFYTTTDECIVK